MKAFVESIGFNHEGGAKVRISMRLTLKSDDEATTYYIRERMYESAIGATNWKTNLENAVIADLQDIIDTYNGLMTYVVTEYPSAECPADALITLADDVEDELSVT